MGIGNPIQPVVTNNQPQAGAQQGQPKRFLSARLALLAMMLYNPVLLVVVIVYLDGPSTQCVLTVTPLCQFAQWSPIAQIGALGGVWFALWLALYLFFGGALEQTGTPRSALARGLRAISDFQNIRDLLAIYASLLIAGFVVALLLGKASWPLFAVVVLTSSVCFWAYGERPARAPIDPLARRGPLYRARAIPPLRWFWPNMPPGGRTDPLNNPLPGGGAGLPQTWTIPMQAGSPPPIDDEPLDNQQVQPGGPSIQADTLPGAGGPPPEEDDLTLPAGTRGMPAEPGQEPTLDPLNAPTMKLPPSLAEPGGPPPALDDPTLPIIPGSASDLDDQPTLPDSRKAARDQEPPAY